MTTPMTPPPDAETERYAQYLAASKMGLVKDREGVNLPDDIWRQCLDEATQKIKSSRAHGGRCAYPDCGGECIGCQS